MTLLSRCKYSLFSLTCIAAATNAVAINSPSSSPEDLLHNANKMLKKLDQQFQGIKILRQSKGFHINAKEVAALLEKADLFYDQRIPYAALYWYSRYQNLIQMPPPKTFLHIQKNLFSIYSQTRQYSKSYQAAKKYTAAFLTTPEKNFSELEEILRQLYQDLRYSKTSKNELRAYISGFSSVSFPAHIHYQMMYLIAKVASQSGLDKVASQWISNAGAFSTAPSLFARSKIFAAILAMRLARYERAHHILTNAISQIDQSNGLWSYYKLFLGRLNLVLDKPKLAESEYQSIPSDSPAYSDSIFELCFLYAYTGKWEQAKAQASLYLGTNTEGPRTNIARRLMPFLDMQAGHFDQANQSLKAGLENIANFEGKLKPFTRSKQYASFEPFKNLEVSLNKLISAPPLSKQLRKKEANLLSLNEQVSSLEGNLQFSLHSISKAKITSYNPDLHHYYLQLLSFGNDLLKVGHMLSSAERAIYKGRMSQSEEVRLTALWNRRKNMMSHKHRFQRNAGPMRTESVFLEKNKIEAKLWQRMQKINAMLTASQHMLAQEEYANKRSLEQSIDYLGKLGTQLDSQVSSLIMQLRKERFTNQADVFKNMPEKVFFRQYSEYLQKESSLYSPYRGKFSTSRGRIQASKLEESWADWNKLTEFLNKDLDAVEKQVRKNVDGSIEGIGTLQEDLKSQRSFINKSSKRFQSIAANSIPFLADYYLYQLSQLRARYQKWIADMKWNQYEIIKSTESRANAAFEAEKAEFENSLFDINNGVLESWQE